MCACVCVLNYLCLLCKDGENDVYLCVPVLSMYNVCVEHCYWSTVWLRFVQSIVNQNVCICTKAAASVTRYDYR